MLHIKKKSIIFQICRLLRKLDGNLTKESIGLMPVLVSFLNHEVADVVRQSIISGAGFICAVLQEITLQVLFVKHISMLTNIYFLKLYILYNLQITLNFNLKIF